MRTDMCLPARIVLVMTVLYGLFWFVGCSSRPTCADRESTPLPASLGKAVNSPEDDYAPFIDRNDQLYFTSDRGEEKSEYKDDRLRYGEGLFVSQRSQNGWGIGRLTPSALSGGVNQGTLTIADNGEAVVARTHDPKEGSMGGSDLFAASIQGTGITILGNLGPAVNSRYWDAQPTIMADGSLLVFASDRQGGLGKSDLWMSTKQADGSWGQAQNLGSEINSSGNEYSPSIGMNGKSPTLFFASDGRPDGKGGLDIYYVTKTSTGWTAAVNASSLGGLVNTSSNDAFPFLTRGQDSLYFASDRPGGCGGYDLYATEVDLPRQRLHGVVRDSTTGRPLHDSAVVTIKSLATNKTVVILHSVPPASGFETELRPGEYRLTVESPGYFLSTPIVVAVEPEKTVKRDLFLVPIPVINTTIAQIDLRSATIPFFVTGYYRLNVTKNLTELRGLLAGPLKNAGYISTEEANSPAYEEYARKVEQLLADSVQDPVKRFALSRFRPTGNEWLEFEITGYADPRDLRYDSKYLEEDIDFTSLKTTMKVRRNQRMDNQTLSVLRAYYAMQYIHAALSQEVENYATWHKAGRIIYKLRGAGVDKTELEYPARRRVRVDVRITNR